MEYEFIVIGGGAMGLAAAHQIAKAKKSVLVLERFCFFNQAGSSNDFVRMFRTMYTEKFMSELAIEAKKLWNILEDEFKQPLIEMTGLLNFGDPTYEDGPEGNLISPIKVMDELGLKYEILNSNQIMERYPFKSIPQNWIGVYAPDNGCINVPLTLNALYHLAKSNGATLKENERVIKLVATPSGVDVECVTQTYKCKKVIITCGAYINDVIQSLGFTIQLDIWEMTSEYYTMELHSAMKFPSMWFQYMKPRDGNDNDSNLFYGFPDVKWGLQGQLRIAVDYATNVIYNPKDRKYTPSEYDVKITSDFVAKKIKGVNETPQFSLTCIMPNTKDNLYVLDFAPKSILGELHKNIIMYTAGWGFKMVPLIGKILSQLAIEGSTSYDISHFNIDRPNILQSLSPSKSTVKRKYARSDVY